MPVLLDLQPMLGDSQKNQTNEFQSQILPIDRPNGPQNILKISAKNDASFLRY
jgi:hypothetical protein